MSAFYQRVYGSYYADHILPRKGSVSVKKLKKLAKSFEFHFGEFLDDFANDAEVLDIGCGSGSLVYYLQQRGFPKAMGIDVSVDQVQAAHDVGIENVIQSDMFEYLRDKKGYYDILFMRDVLEHVEMPMVLNILDLCYRALKERGRLIVMTPNGESPVFGRIRYGDITHCCAFTTTSMAHLFRISGFHSFCFKPFESRPVKMSLYRKLFTKQGHRILKKRIAWHLTKKFYRFIISAEVGNCDPILTFNLIACAVKEDERGSAEPAPCRKKKALIWQRKKDVAGPRKRNADSRQKTRRSSNVAGRMKDKHRRLRERYDLVKERIRKRRDIRRRAREERITQNYFEKLEKNLPQGSFNGNYRDTKQILLFGDMGIGNLLMYIPFMRSLREAFPDTEIVLLFIKNKGSSSVPLAEGLIDRKVSLSMPRKPGIRAYKEIRDLCKKLKLRPDILISRWSASAYWTYVIYATKAPVRIGHVTSAGFEGYNDRVFNYPIKMKMSEHEVDRHLNLLHPLGIQSQEPKMEMLIDEDSRRSIARLLGEKKIDPARTVCFHIGTSRLQTWKRWDTAKWFELARRLLDCSLNIAFLGDEDDSVRIHSNMERYGIVNHERVFNFAGQHNLKETAELIRRCKVVVATDSALMHVAVAVETFVVAIFGPTEYERTRPYTRKSVVLRRPCRCNGGSLFNRRTVKRIEECSRPCINDVTVEEAYETVASCFPEEPLIAKDDAKVWENPGVL